MRDTSVELSQKDDYGYSSKARDSFQQSEKTAAMSASPSSRNAVVIVAAGRGARMGNILDGPKQYRPIGDIPILQHTVNAFASSPLIDLIQVVIHRDDRDLYGTSVSPHHKLLAPVLGGATRQQSSLAGLNALAASNITNVLIHDAARPFVDKELIARVISAIEPGTSIIPAIAVSETVKRASAENSRLWVCDTVPRDNLHLAQTPQGFRFYEILEAHLAAAKLDNHDFTDDAAVGEQAGIKVGLVEGTRDNIKITTLSDLEYTNNMNNLNNKIKVPDIRTGNGYDIHRLVAGDKVILCGIEIPFDRKLDGHSDADVGLHALTDALLGTIGSGDIGSHFPPSDPQWRGVSSDRFLAHACQLVAAHGGIITHLDVTLICEMPKIGPHREKMRARIAEICAMDMNRISVKATTNETIGAIGRGEGIAAMATATVVIMP